MRFICGDRRPALNQEPGLQFADDSVIISNSSEGAQKLIDINHACCKWTGMTLRVDKCCTFGMRKMDGRYEQFFPQLTINDTSIPQVKINDHFTYLRKI